MNVQSVARVFRLSFPFSLFVCGGSCGIHFMGEERGRAFLTAMSANKGDIFSFRLTLISRRIHRKLGKIKQKDSVKFFDVSLSSRDIAAEVTSFCNRCRSGHY